MKCEPLLLVVTRDDHTIVRDSAGVSERHPRNQVMSAEKARFSKPPLRVGVLFSDVLKLEDSVETRQINRLKTFDSAIGWWAR